MDCDARGAAAQECWGSQWYGKQGQWESHTEGIAESMLMMLCFFNERNERTSSLRMRPKWREVKNNDDEVA
jgi:hypothetical protein